MAKKKNQNPVNNVAALKKGGNFVTVMSKIPFGVKFNTPDGKVYEIQGMNQSKIVKSEGISGYYAVTRLPEDVWAYFAKTYNDKPFMKQKHIFANVSAKRAEAEAKELGDNNKTKLEQINPKEVPNIKTAEEKPQGVGVTV